VLCFCSFRNPLFFLPAFFLILFLGLLGVMEYRIQERDVEIQKILKDPEPALLFDLHQATWNFQKTLDNAEASSTIAFQTVPLQEAAGLIETKLGPLVKILKTNPYEKEEQTHDYELIVELQGAIDEISAILKDGASISPAAAIVLKRYSGVAIHTVHMLQEGVSEAHQAQVNHRLIKNDQETKYRLIFLSLVIISGFLLGGALVRNASCMQKNADAARSAERFNAIFAAALQSIQVGVMIRSALKDGDPVLFINNAFTEITGYGVDDVRNKKSDFLFGWNTDPETIESFHKTVADRTSATFNFLSYRKDGSPFWSEWHLSPVTDKNGSPTHYVILLNDITPLRQTQEALVVAKEQAEHASTVKTQFLAVMSHEIRTPINGLMGVLSLLMDTSLTEEQTKLAKIAVASGKSLLDIINDILDYSKMEAGKTQIITESFSLREVLQGVLDITLPMAQGKGIALQLFLPEQIPDKFLSDPGRLRQVMINLVGNAIKFTDHGEVGIRIIHLLNQEDHGAPVALLRFEVTDTGIGINLADQEKLFKEFSQIEHAYSRRFGGTGLGLAITRRLVRMLKGDIGVESKPNQGSKFWFMIPMPLDVALANATETSQLAASESYPEHELPQTARILLVEDNDTNRFVASRYLMKAGYCPDVAATGLEAVEMSRTGIYDLILMDVSMPEMDGLEATQKIRSQGGWTRTVPIIALTAHVMEGDRERCLSAGMDDYLNKPIEYSDLVRMLGHWLAASTPPQPLPPEPEAATTAISDKPEMDANVLRRLETELSSAAVFKIIDVFLKDLAQRETLFSQTYAIENLDQLSHEAHTIKSSSASCGLLRLSDLMQQIEAAAREDRPELIPDLLAQAPEILKKARESLLREQEKFKA